jgi:hypothetical protein
MLLGFLGALAVLLSAFLVVNTIIALLGQHIPQICIMEIDWRQFRANQWNFCF